MRGNVHVQEFKASMRDSPPQLIVIHIHLLFRILYTLFRLDTVNIYWWWYVNVCRASYILSYSLLVLLFI